MDRSTQQYVDMTAGEMQGDQSFNGQSFQGSIVPRDPIPPVSFPAPPVRPIHNNFVAENPFTMFGIPSQNPGRPTSYANQPFNSGDVQANHFPIQGVESPPINNNGFNNFGYPGGYQSYAGHLHPNQAQGYAPNRHGFAVVEGYQSTTGAQGHNIGSNGTANLPIDLTENNGHGSQNMMPQNLPFPVNTPRAASPQPTESQPVRQGRAKKTKPVNAAKSPRQTSPPAGPSPPNEKGKKAVSNAANKRKKAEEEVMKSYNRWEEEKNKAKAREEAASSANSRQSIPDDPTDEPATGGSKDENDQTNKAEGKGDKKKSKRGEPKRYDIYAPGNRTKMALMQDATRLFMGSRSFRAPTAVGNDGAETLGASQIQQAEKLVATHGDIREKTMEWWNQTWKTKITAPELTETVKRMLEMEQKKKEANGGVIVVDLGPVERVSELRKKMGKEDLFRDLWKEVKDDHSNGYSREVWAQMNAEDRQVTKVLNAYETLNSHGLLSDEEVHDVQAHGEKWTARAKDPNWTGPKFDFPEPERIEVEKQPTVFKREEGPTPRQEAEKAPQPPTPSQEQDNAETTDMVAEKDHQATQPAPEKPPTGNIQKNSGSGIEKLLSNVPKPLKHKKAAQNTTSHGMESANSTTRRLLNNKESATPVAKEEEEDPDTLRQSNGKYSWETAHLGNSEKTNQSKPEADSASKHPSTAKNSGEVNAGDEGKMPSSTARKGGGTLGRPRGSGAGSRGGRKKAAAVKKEDDSVENFLLGVKDSETSHKVTKTRGRGRGRGQGGGRGAKGPTKRMTKKQKEAAAAAAEEVALAEAEATLLAEMDVDLEEDEKNDSETADTPGMAPTAINTPNNTLTGPEQRYNASSSEESDVDDDEAPPAVAPTFQSPPYVAPPSDAPLRKRPTTRRSGVDPYAYIAVPNAREAAEELTHKARDWQAAQQAAERQAREEEYQKVEKARKTQSDRWKELRRMENLAKMEEQEKWEEMEAKKANKPKRVKKTQKRKRAEDEDDMTQEMQLQEARKKLLKEYGYEE